VSLGSVNESIAHPRDVFRPAIIASAYAVIVAHNHPSGDPSPSQSDHSLTRRLAEAAELLQIKLLDHIIIGADRGWALKHEGLKGSVLDIDN
jgi:DNA repair protein RadC